MNVGYLEFSCNGNCRQKYLQEQLMQVQHNLLCYSRNFLMTEPKRGFENEWQDAKEKEQLLIQMLNEFPDEEGSTLYVGNILDFPLSCGDERFVLFEVADSKKYFDNFSITLFFKVDSQITNKGVQNFVGKTEIRHKEDKPNLVRVKVKRGCIYNIEWVDEWDWG